MDRMQIEAIFQRGNALANAQKFTEAAEQYRAVIRLDAKHAMAHNNLGVSLTELQCLPEAIDAYRFAISIDSNYADGHYNLANALKTLGQLVEAVKHFRLAIAAHPVFASAYNNLAIALMAIGNLEEAVEQFQSALQIEPNMANAWNGLGLTLLHLGRNQEALLAIDRSLAISPNSAESHYNKGLALLLHGDFANGWREYEWRWRLPESPPRNFCKPQWHGEPLDGKTILLHTEQGIGDAIQFVRFAFRLQQLGARVVLECDAHCTNLFECCQGIDLIVVRGQAPLPEFDFHCPLMSLGQFLVRDESDLVCDIPYLHPPSDGMLYWKQHLSQYTGLKIGIAWQGSKGYRWDHLRSISLALFEPLSRIKDVSLFSLQKGTGAEQARTCSFEVYDLGSRIDNEGQAFADTLALLPSLDFVVATDSAIIHAAGALGIKTCVLLPIGPDWRWHVGSNQSHWYPTVRLFRQSCFRDWNAVMSNVAEYLSDYQKARR